MELRSIIKCFDFEETNRSRITLDANSRLHPDYHRLQLKADSDGEFPTDADIEARTWVANPLNVRAWESFQADITHSKDTTGAVVTAVGFRLSDGTDDYWWDGGAWDNAPAAGEWNTEAEIAANIATFPVVDRKIQVILNLSTTDPDFTPYVWRVKVLYSSDIEIQEDILYRSLVRDLRENVRPIADYYVKMQAAGTTIDLTSDYPLETAYNIIGIDAVFNKTTDPDFLTDIFQSYDTGTKVITLTGSVAQDDIIKIRFTYEPEIVVTTSQDYTELQKVPAVIIEGLTTERGSELGKSDHVISRSSGEGKKIDSPLRADIVGTMRAVTDKGIDLMRLADRLKRYFANNHVLRSRGLDEEYRLRMETEFSMGAGSPGEDVRDGTLTFRIVDVLFFEKDPVTVYAVQRFNLTGDMDTVVEN